MTTEATTAPAVDDELPAGTVEEQVTWLASLIAGHEAEVTALAAEAKKHNTEIDRLKAKVRGLVPVGKHTYGNVTVTVSNPSRSFDAAAFMKAYPVELNPALYKEVIDTAALPPKLKDQFMVEGKGEPKVAIK
jgi:hypothetical protein